MLKSRLKIARTKAKLTQAQAASAIGVSRSAVGQWEIGASKPDHDNLVAAASVYSVAVEWLLGDGGDDEIAIFANNAHSQCDRTLIRSVATYLYGALEVDGLAMEPSDFAALLLTLYDWAVDEVGAGRTVDGERVKWFVRVARSRPRR